MAWVDNKMSKRWVTYRAHAHSTLIALSGWEEVVFGEGFPRLIHTSIMPAGSDWSSEACRDPGLLWGDTSHMRGLTGWSPTWLLRHTSGLLWRSTAVHTCEDGGWFKANRREIHQNTIRFAFKTLRHVSDGVRHGEHCWFTGLCHTQNFRSYCSTPNSYKSTIVFTYNRYKTIPLF